MKKIVIYVLIFFMMTPLFACKDKPDDKTIPEYLGMVVQSSNTSTVSLGHSNRHDGKPHIHDDDFKEDKIEEDIENLISISVESDNEVKYYVQPGEVFTLVVKLNNPDDFEIQSFTLNGKKYANYMFEDGSDMENLYLKVTAPTNSGYTEYTIDAIKYIDGTEIKDVDLSKGDQSIKAGIKYLSEPYVTVSNQVISTTSCEFDINVVNTNNLLQDRDVKLYLSDGVSIIRTQDLVIGNNSIEINDLLINTAYQFAVISSYDICDGNDVKSRLLLKSNFTTLDMYNISSVVADQTSVQFEINKTGNVGEIDYISLHDKDNNYAFIKEITDFENLKFTDLLSNHNYTIKLAFKYTINEEEIEGSNLYNFTTQSKTAPVVNLVDITTTQTAVSFDIDVEDVDSIYEFVNVELIKDNNVVKTLNDITSKTFDNLLSNNEYIIKVNYTYDLNDGTGIKEVSATGLIVTKSKSIPVISVVDEEITSDSITGNISVTDIDNICNTTKIELYKGTTLIEENLDKKVKFEELSSYTNYTVKITYQYNLNDGQGVINDYIEFDFKTQPTFSFVDFSIINTTSVSEGDTIYIQANINNPSRATYSSVVINGKTYNVTTGSTNSRLIVELLNEGQFAGGETTLTIEQVNLTLDGEDYVIEVKENNSDSIFINGRLEVLDVYMAKVVDGQYIKVEQAYSEDNIYMYISLSNPTCYNINSVVVRNKTYTTEIIEIDNNHIAVPVGYLTEDVYQFYNIKSISFSNDFIAKEQKVDIQLQRLIRIPSEIVYVSNYEQLLNMKERKHYILQNDIDLKGKMWTPYKFHGVLDGNNYSIKNLTHVGDINENINFGLFSETGGYIKNLNIDNVSFIAVKQSSVSASVSLFGNRGGMGVVFDNVSVDIFVQVNNGEYYGGTSVSGFLSFADLFVEFINCDVTGFVSITDGSVAGYVLSQTSGGDTSFNNCIVDIETSGNLDYSGFIGSIGLCPNVIFNNCFAASDCFINYTDQSCSVVVNNCLVFPGRFIMDNDAHETVNNSYYVWDFIVDEVLVYDQLNDKNFYLNTLHWDESIWNLDNLDFENGVYPTLK